tara:strand:- start:201 stop:455 length:255 start_codon:yes stop_codon:yes gene_type:complete
LFFSKNLGFFSRKNPDFPKKNREKKSGSEPSEKSKDMTLNFVKRDFTNSIFQNFGFFSPKKRGGSEKPERQIPFSENQNFPFES